MSYGAKELNDFWRIVGLIGVQNTLAMSNIEIYTNPDNQTEVRAHFGQDTVWLSLNQMAVLFDRGKSVISMHLRNIFTECELHFEATVAKNATVQSGGGREAVRDIEYFNLEAIIFVGYRVNSRQETRFRM